MSDAPSAASCYLFASFNRIERNDVVKSALMSTVIYVGDVTPCLHPTIYNFSSSLYAIISVLAISGGQTR